MQIMKKTLILGAAACAVLLSCRRDPATPRPTTALVHSILADTTGVYQLAAKAGNRGAEGSIALIGEPSDAIALARCFQTSDQKDNIDGRGLRDGLPDFAGESFDVILDAYNEPYSHFLSGGPDAPSQVDSLRDAAVRNALFAWDSTCVSSAFNPDARLHKSRAKALVFTSSLQAEFGLFDIDTLQQLSGGCSRLISPVHVMLDQAYGRGARNLAVWTTRTVRTSGTWQAVFGRKGWADAYLMVITPEQALDVRTELRNLLRQYRSCGKRLDALLIDSYSIDPALLHSELELIRREGTEEDMLFSSMLSSDMCLLLPIPSLLEETYSWLRKNNLFTHRIARPVLHYFETDESDQGTPLLVEADASYVQSAYVQSFN